MLLALREYTSSASPQVMQGPQRLDYAKSILTNWFSLNQYMAVHKDIFSATASRDLADGLKDWLLAVNGISNQALYRFEKTAVLPL